MNSRSKVNLKHKRERAILQWKSNLQNEIFRVQFQKKCNLLSFFSLCFCGMRMGQGRGQVENY